MTANPEGTDYILAEDFLTRFPAEAVAQLEAMPWGEIATFLASLSPDVGARTLDRLRTDTAVEVVQLLDQETRRTLLGAADPDAGGGIAGEIGGVCES